MTLRPLIRDLVRGPLRSPLDRRGGWSPAILFSAGEQGGWYDPSDFSTQFQDSAGTTPVTAAGQPVGKVLDKSGRGNHLIQATAASRPVLQQDASGFWYWSFDGVDDGLATAATLNLSGTQIASTWVGVRKNADSIGTALGLASTGGAGTFDILTTVAGMQFRLYGANAPSNDARVTTEAAPQMKVISCVFNNSTDSGAALTILPRENGAIPGLATASDLTTQPQAMANATLQIGGVPGQFSNTRIYGVVLRGANSSAAEISNGERYVGNKMGIAL